jgi:2-alkyl-3-oxoalkanoate reductase
VDVFVTGGTGVLGRPVLRLLRASGHRARALARDERAGAAIRELGGEPVRADLFEPAGLRPAVAGCEAVLHLATRIPTGPDAGLPGAWAENDRIRAEGTRSVVDAALAVGASAFVYPSVVLVYPDRGAEWLEAGAPPSPPEHLRSTLVAEAEVARCTAGGGRGVVLRMGRFYGPSAAFSRDLVAAARGRGALTLNGADDAYQSLVWVEDAASAVLAALERAPAGVYDVVDDEPLTVAELAAVLASAVGRSHLDRPGRTRGRSQRVTNRRFREATGWSPAVRDARDGLRRLAAAPGDGVHGRRRSAGNSESII